MSSLFTLASLRKKIFLDTDLMLMFAIIICHLLEKYRKFSC